MGRLLVLTKWMSTIGVVAGLAIFVCLGEWTRFSNDLADIAKREGLSLPLQDARIVVSPAKLTLTVYADDKMLKSYDIAIGPGLPGSGLVDKGTPFGEFAIVGKHSRENIDVRGSRWMALSYPDVAVCDAALAADVISPVEYKAFVSARSDLREPPYNTALGGPLTIQGNYFFFRDGRFTDGSIALTNADVNEIFDCCPIGTQVIIKD